MDDLVTWLLAQVAKDEHRIKRMTLAAAGGWRYDRERFRLNELDSEGQVRWNLASHADGGEQPIGDVLGEYMENFQPARMLAECEAKRRILEDLGMCLNSRPADPDDEGWVESRAEEARDILRIMALPYADREGFKESWKI